MTNVTIHGQRISYPTLLPIQKTGNPPQKVEFSTRNLYTPAQEFMRAIWETVAV